LKIESGDLSGDILVTVNGDDVFERAEKATFGALPANGEDMVDTTLSGDDQHTATLTLKNDDDVPSMKLNETTGLEGTILRVIGTMTGTRWFDLVHRSTLWPSHRL
jgi:hypothetical protein